MNATLHIDGTTQLLKCLFIVGILLCLVGGAMIPAVTVLAPDSPIDGPGIIDHWATFKVRFPGNVITVTGGLLMGVPACGILWRSFFAGYRDGTKRPKP